MSTTVIVPLVGAVPVLLGVSVYVPFVPTTKLPACVLARFRSGVSTVSVSVALQAPVVALKLGAGQLVPGLVTPAGGVTVAVLVTVVCANAGIPAMTSKAEANDSMILRPEKVATKFDVSATYIPYYIQTRYVRAPACGRHQPHPRLPACWII